MLKLVIQKQSAYICAAWAIELPVPVSLAHRNRWVV